MKGLKTGIAIAGLLGIAATFLPYFSGADGSLWDQRKPYAEKAYVPLAAFGLAVAITVLAAAAGGLSRTKSLLTFIAFSVTMLCGSVRLGLTGVDPYRTSIGGKLLFVAAALGLLLALISIIRPEKS